MQRILSLVLAGLVVVPATSPSLAGRHYALTVGVKSDPAARCYGVTVKSRF
jgi:hypothetical protein